MKYMYRINWERECKRERPPSPSRNFFFIFFWRVIRGTKWG